MTRDGLCTAVPKRRVILEVYSADVTHKKIGLDNFFKLTALLQILNNKGGAFG